MRLFSSFFVQLLFWAQKKKYGSVLNASREWAKVPHFYFPFVWFYTSLTRKSSPLDPRLRQILMTQVARWNECAFCVDLNASLLRKTSGEDALLAELPNWPTSTAFSAREKLALEYAERMTVCRKPVTEDLRERLRVEFSDAQLLELTAAIAFQNLSAKFNQALGVADQNFLAQKNF